MLLSDLLPATIAWHPADGDLVLLAVVESDLAVAETVLATLPAKTRGQVFVEVDSVPEGATLAAPGRVCVTWLGRDRGQSLRTAVEAWMAEMLPVQADREHRVYAWISGQPAAQLVTSN
ncbi:MAG TPA: SIP domain-containing protein [Pseudolysinimonas sp.]|nr:SIP domain-containing protein [Pseudolysinimonas sp.]